LSINAGSDTTYQIEVIGMKPNGNFYFSLGDFLRIPSVGHRANYGWYRSQEFLTMTGVDLSNVQADINGHWSMTLTVLVAKMYILMDICKLQVLVQMIQMLI
jgi:hypothetical protein